MILQNRWIKNKILTAFAVLLSASLAGMPITAAAKVEDDAIYTQDGIEDYQAEIARNKAQAIQTNLDPAWPQGPAVGAAGAVVMDADSGAVLYGKNMDKHLFPASITKLMTALLAYENLDPEDTVTFSENAVFGIESGSSNIGMDVGEAITVDQALYGLMVASANEVAVALAERVSGTEEEFVALMNQRAIELGCKNTHFVTSNGLHDSDHYTCAYDMALIGREIFKHPDLINYMSQLNYHFEASAKQPDDFWLLNTNDFLTQEIPCDDIVGGKTGYTDQARETLVSFAERDGKKLVCVIMREEPPYQYYDTIDLLNYAFDNFKQLNIAAEEKRFTQESADFLSSGPDVFGKSATSFYIDKNALLMIPNNASFSDLTAEITPAPYKPAVQEGDSAKAEDNTQETNTETSSGEESTDSTESSEGSTTAAAEAQNPADTQTTADNQNTADAQNTTDTQTTAQAAEAEAAPAETISSSSVQGGDKVVGIIQYKYHDYSLGSANVLFRSQTTAAADSGEESSAVGSTTAAAEYTPPGDTQVPTALHGIRSLLFSLVHTGAHGSVYLNILLLVPLILALTFLLCILIFVYDHFAQRSPKRRKQMRRAQRENRQNGEDPDSSDPYDDYDADQTPRFDREGNRGRRNTYESERTPAQRTGRPTAARRSNTATRRSNAAGRTAEGSRTAADRRSGSAGRTARTAPDRRSTTAGRTTRTAPDRRSDSAGRMTRTAPDRRSDSAGRTGADRRSDSARRTARTAPDRRSTTAGHTGADRRSNAAGRTTRTAPDRRSTTAGRTDADRRSGSAGRTSTGERRTYSGQNTSGSRDSRNSRSYSSRPAGDRYSDSRRYDRYDSGSSQERPERDTPY